MTSVGRPSSPASLSRRRRSRGSAEPVAILLTTALDSPEMKVSGASTISIRHAPGCSASAWRTPGMLTAGKYRYICVPDRAPLKASRPSITKWGA